MTKYLQPEISRINRTVLQPTRSISRHIQNICQTTVNGNKNQIIDKKSGVLKAFITFLKTATTHHNNQRDLRG